MSKKMILFVNVGVIVLFLIILEVGSRIIFGTTPNQAANAMISDNVMNHKWRPNSASVDTNWGIPFTIYVNKQSWLARYDITVSKPKNTIRIFYVGDSNTEGVVAEDKKMASIVSKGLNDTMKNRGKHIEVINTGTSSWSPSQYYLEIKDKILTYSPDIVIIDYDMSDVQNDGDYKKLTTFDNDGLPVAIR